MKISSKRITLLIAVFILLSLVVVMSYYQVREYLKYKKDNEEVVLTSAKFDVPLRQSIEVSMIIKNDNGDKIIDNDNKEIQYSDLKNYKEENLARYQQYHKDNPDLLDADVVWRVNTNLDYNFYTNIREVENLDSPLMIVNKYNKLPNNYIPSDLKLVSNFEEEIYIKEEVLEAFKKMQENIKKEDLKIQITQGYISYNNQVSEYNLIASSEGVEVADKESVRPGHSEFQSGLAILVEEIDGERDFKDSDSFLWLKDNAHRFGFILRYRSDESLTGYKTTYNHLRYVGSDLAIDMYEANINVLEEFLDKRGITDE